jgi:drug/metabolite transporter (DMT)-like permease
MNHREGLAARLWGFAPLLLATAVLFWAGNSVMGRAMAGIVPPMALSFWRWTFAFLVATPLAWGRLKTDWRVLVKHWPIVLGLGVSGVASFGALVYVGVQTTTALNSILLQAAMPPIILLFAWISSRERTTGGQIAGIALSLLGVLVIISAGRPWNLLHLALNPGDALVMIGVVLYAIYSLLLRFRPPVHPFSLLWATFGIAVLALAPLYAFELASGRSFALGRSALLGIGYVALFPSVFAYLCFNRGVELIGAARAGQFMHLMPIFGSILAVMLLGERFHAFHAVGLVLIAAGIGTASLAARAAAAPTHEPKRA